MHSDKRALILLDLQHDFLRLDGRLPIEAAQMGTVIDAANAAIGQAEEADVPVIAIRNAFPPSDWLRNLFRRHAAMAGSPGAEWDARVPLGSAPVFDKGVADAFSTPALGRHLRRAQVDHLIVGGVFASACVSATVRSAIERGFRVTLLEPAIGDSSQPRKARAMRRLAELGATVASGMDRTSPAPVLERDS